MGNKKETQNIASLHDYVFILKQTTAFSNMSDI